MFSFTFYRKNVNKLSEFSACFLIDLHCRKSFLVLGTMLLRVTVEITDMKSVIIMSRENDPCICSKTFLI